MCPEDYDTRGWTNELGYLALLFDRYQDRRFGAIIARLLELEGKGAFADKWGYVPAPEDPFCAWAAGDRQAIPVAAPDARAALGLLAPKPARGSVWVPVRVGEPASIRLTIHDPAGRRVRKLLEGQVSGGAQRVRWDGRDEANRPAQPGMYFVRLEVDGKLVGTARLVLVR